MYDGQAKQYDYAQHLEELHVLLQATERAHAHTRMCVHQDSPTLAFHTCVQNATMALRCTSILVRMESTGLCSCTSLGCTVADL